MQIYNGGIRASNLIYSINGININILIIVINI